ncbi:Holliday junction ATP-dependent DNA helicase RuvB [Lysinibacillus sphaericus]
MSERMIASEAGRYDEQFELSLRPQRLAQYIGQQKVKENLQIFIEAAKLRQESLDHVRLDGPPGLGKTTLAAVIANEMNVNVRMTSGPAIERPGDLAAILSSLEPGDVLFIDEIHRLPRAIEEVLYPAMEDFCLDIVVGKNRKRVRFVLNCHLLRLLVQRQEPVRYQPRYEIDLVYCYV